MIGLYTYIVRPRIISGVFGSVESGGIYTSDSSSYISKVCG